jgi:hypothetical protein
MIRAYDQTKTDNDILFYRLDPESGMRCGLTYATLKGEMQAVYYIPGASEPEFVLQLGELEISLAIPWFIRK